MVPVPEEDLILERFYGLDPNPDGTWTVHVYVCSPDGSFTPREDKITLEERGGNWYLAAIRTEL